MKSKRENTGTLLSELKCLGLEKEGNVFKLIITMLQAEEHSMVRKHIWILGTSDRKVSLRSLSEDKEHELQRKPLSRTSAGPLALEHPLLTYL